MQLFRYHVFVCDQKKPEGAPCCAARGSARVIDALRAEVAAQGLGAQVQITACGSFGLCERGPNVVVYPEGTWYSGVAPGDVAEIVREHFSKGVPVARLLSGDPEALRAEMEENRRKRIAALQAREAAGIMPDELMQTIRGFQESRALLTAIELDVYGALGKGATAAELASRIGGDPRATEMLLNALVSLETLEKTGGVFRNTPISERHLAGNPRAALMHTVRLWPRWSTLTECVRAGTAVLDRDTAARDEDWTEAFIAAMHQNATGRAPQVVQAVGAAGVRRLLDVGGGSGAYSIAFARANPDLRADILDVPSVVPIARRHIAAAGLGERVQARIGDLRADSFGGGYDLVFLSAICHMLGADENRRLLRKSRAALEPGGRVVIQDFILEADKTAPRTAALFALNMLVGTAEGSAYSEDEYAAWLRETGFPDVQRIRLPGPTGLMIGRT